MRLTSTMSHTSRWLVVFNYWARWVTSSGWVNSFRGGSLLNLQLTLSVGCDNGRLWNLLVPRWHHHYSIVRKVVPDCVWKTQVHLAWSEVLVWNHPSDNVITSDEFLSSVSKEDINEDGDATWPRDNWYISLDITFPAWWAINVFKV